jgi:hypothetical protein
MRKSIKIILLTVGILIISLLSITYFTKPTPPPVELSIEDEVRLKTHNGFLHVVGHKESFNRYDVVNRLGYMGKYQFSYTTLKSLGYNITREEFLNNPCLQEEAMSKLLAENYKTLKKYIDKYDGEVVHGICVTKSGILAAAHLGGAGNVRRWFRRGASFKDGNGIDITTYMKKFSNYNLNL